MDTPCWKEDDVSTKMGGPVTTSRRPGNALQARPSGHTPRPGPGRSTAQAGGPVSLPDDDSW